MIHFIGNLLNLYNEVFQGKNEVMLLLVRRMLKREKLVYRALHLTPTHRSPKANFKLIMAQEVSRLHDAGKKKNVISSSPKHHGVAGDAASRSRPLCKGSAS